jgi:hypothetical protein
MKEDEVSGFRQREVCSVEFFLSNAHWGIDEMSTEGSRS